MSKQLFNVIAEAIAEDDYRHVIGYQRSPGEKLQHISEESPQTRQRLLQFAELDLVELLDVLSRLDLQIVPKVATPEMVAAAMQVDVVQSHTNPTTIGLVTPLLIYTTMLSAAPSLKPGKEK